MDTGGDNSSYSVQVGDKLATSVLWFGCDMYLSASQCIGAIEHRFSDSHMARGTLTKVATSTRVKCMFSGVLIRWTLWRVRAGRSALRGVCATGARAVTHVPLAQIGGLWPRQSVSSQIRRRRHKRRGGGLVARARRRWRLAVYFHVFAQGARVCVGLVAASHFAVVRLVAGVHVRVLLPVAAVGEASITAIKLALEWFLAYVQNKWGNFFYSWSAQFDWFGRYIYIFYYYLLNLLCSNIIIDLICIISRTNQKIFSKRNMKSTSVCITS